MAEKAEGLVRKREGSPIWMRMLGRKVQFVLDLAVLSAAFVLSYLLRFEFDVPPEQIQASVIQLPSVVLLQFALLFVTGVYAFIWRYIGMAEVGAFVKAAAGSFLVLLCLRLSLPDAVQPLRVPLSIIAMDTVLGFGGVISLRVLRRALYERYEKQIKVAGKGLQEAKPVLLVGAGQAGVMVAKEIAAQGGAGLDVRGFVDDDPEKQGALLQGIKVIGKTEDIPRLVKSLGIDHVILTIARASSREVKRIVDLCESVPVKARIIPGLYEIIEGKVSIQRIRDVDIEDLLGRDPVRLDVEEVGRFLAGKVVMVTGAGGSIGSELCRQVARMGPSKLLLLERAEFALFEIHRELTERWPRLEILPLVADAGDEPRVDALMARHKPEVLFHSAAHKHVPMMEWNPCEAVKNNVLATEVVGRLAGVHGTEAFVFISTDKAVRPTSVMGASKRAAELVVQALDKRYQTRYVAVRFGNVLGSTGSVIPLFREQIRRGGPVTVTHPDMVRYFMTIPEAAQLVLQAGAMGKGGEIFVLDMGEPVRILDLAEQMISLSGFRPHTEIPIVFTGVRPGEKIQEVLLHSDEAASTTRHPKIYIGQINSVSPEKVDAAVERLGALARAGREADLRAALADFLPESKLF